MNKKAWVEYLGWGCLLIGILWVSQEAWPEESRLSELSGLPPLVRATPSRSSEVSAPWEKKGATLADEPFFVLCYHRFLFRPDDTDDETQAEYQLPLDEFKWQMRYLKDHGFTPISDGQLMDYWFKGIPLPLKPVLITFDDGFRTIYRDAFPVVKPLGYPSILFLYTKFIEYREAADRKKEKPDLKAREPKGREVKTEALTDEDILEMQSSGMVVESHTANHLNLGKVHEKKEAAVYERLLHFELNEPLTFIGNYFKRKPEMIAYPYGVYDPAILRATREAGYKLAFTVNPGPNDRTVPPLMLKRNLILYPISHERFAGIFTDKVLHLDSLYPGDGQEISGFRPVISARIMDEIDPRSLRLQLGNHVMRVNYDSKTHLISHPIGADLKQGGHIFCLTAKDMDGQKRVYNWYFRVKYKHSKNNETDKDSKDEATQN